MVSMDTYAVAKGLSEAHRENIAERDRAIDRWMAYAKKLERELKAELAYGAGVAAHLAAMKKAHPDSPLLADSGERYKTGKNAGKPKPKGRLIFEAAFDAEARKRGITNPAEIRGD